jgi:hypothetical protein
MKVGAAVRLLAWFGPGLVGGGDSITQCTLDGSDSSLAPVRQIDAKPHPGYAALIQIRETLPVKDSLSAKRNIATPSDE